MTKSNQKSTISAMGLRPRALVFKITKSKFTPTSGKKYHGLGGNTGNVKEGSNSARLTPKKEVY